MPNILILCTANVCRSVYAAVLVGQALKPESVSVRAAGLKAVDGHAACPLVIDRLRTSGLAAPNGGARLVDKAALEAAELILVMTAGQRVAAAKLLPEARVRTMTLIEAIAVANELERRGTRCESLPDYVLQLNFLRSRVAMPTVRERRMLLGCIPVRGRAKLAVSIADGHTSGSAREHTRTLDQIATGVDQLQQAWSRQPWAPAPDDEVSA